MIFLDLSGLKCPLPALRTRKALRSMTAGILEVHCTDPLAGIDIPNVVRETGDRLLEARRNGKILVFIIEKYGPAEAKAG